MFRAIVHGLGRLIVGFSDQLPGAMRDHIRAALGRLALSHIAVNKMRVVDRGLDRFDSPFAPYSSNYLRYKEARLGRGVDHVDLFGVGKQSGHLMASLQYVMEDARTAALIFVSGAPAGYGYKHQKGLDGMPKREWMGFSPADLVVLQQVARAEIGTAIGGALKASTS